MKRPLCVICMIYLAIQCASIWIQSRTDARNDALELSGTLFVAGTVERIEEKEKVTAVFLTENRISVSDGSISEPKILAYVNPDQNHIRIGNRILISGEGETFSEARNPGNFDQKFYYEKQEIRLLVWAEQIKVISSETDPVKDFLYSLRTEWKKKLFRHLGEYYGGTMSAVLLGEKSGLDEEMKKMYQKNGIGHILAISGLHMSFIGSGLYGLLRRAGIPFSGAALCGGIILILYTVMIGASVSAVRALLMFLTRVGADVCGRDYDLPTSLAVSAAAVCICQPLNLQDAAFQLSYGAILGIALLSPVFSDMLKFSGKEKAGKTGWIVSLLSGMGSSLSVTMFLMGPLLYFYFEVPLYSSLLNLFVIPAMSFIMAAGLFGSLLTLIWDPLGGLVLAGCKAGLAGYDKACALAGALPGSRLVTGQPPVWWIILYYGVMALIYAVYRRMKSREKKQEEEGKIQGKQRGISLRIPGILLFCFGMAMPFLCRAWHTYQGDMQITVLDVGQGDGIFIRSDSGKAFFIDGGSSDVSSVGTYRIEPFLLAEGVDTLEYVFLSHGDRDHLSGITEMLSNQNLGIRIRNLVLPPSDFLDETLIETARIAGENGTRIIEIKPGEVIRDQASSGRFTLACLAPADFLTAERGSNSASMVLELTYGAFSMLFTGDLEGAGERALADSGRLKPYTVLKAAHHGSRSSGSDEFLSRVSPSIAIISAGVDNRYGHPHRETVERLKKAGCNVYSTQDCGALTIRTDGCQVRISGFLRSASCQSS